MIALMIFPLLQR